MKLFHFINPRDYRFARAGRLGTWRTDPGPPICPECGRTRERRVPPLILEWLPDSDVVGDFTWPGINDEIVVSQRVREAFESHYPGLEYHPIEMFQEPKLKRPERPNKRAKPRVWLPYEGSPLWDMQTSAWASLDHERSGVHLERVCAVCHRPLYRTPPFQERHLVLDRSTWGGQEIFQIREYAGWRFCTERVKDLVFARGFTNAGFALDGEIPD